jgi:hypothetical protein
MPPFSSSSPSCIEWSTTFELSQHIVFAASYTVSQSVKLKLPSLSATSREPWEVNASTWIESALSDWRMVGFLMILLADPSEVRARKAEVAVMARGIEADSKAMIAV